MRVLVTGAGGRLGMAIAEHAPPDWNLDLRNRSQLNISDLHAVEQAVRDTDVVINCAAYTDVDGAESDREAAHISNEVGPQKLAEATAGAGVLLVHFSTDYVFNGNKTTPYVEDDPTGPLSVYGTTKLAGERAVTRINPEHLVIRTAWLYDNEGPSFLRMLAGLASKREVRVVDDQCGSPTYVPHLVDGLARLVNSGIRGTIHLAGSGGASRYELATCFYDLVGIQTELLPAKTQDFPTPATRPSYSVLDTTHSAGVRLPPWKEGLKAFVDREQS